MKMNEAKHIAGTPWKVNGSDSTTAIWVEDAGGQRVCTVRNCDVDRAALALAEQGGKDGAS